MKSIAIKLLGVLILSTALSGCIIIDRSADFAEHTHR
jgi:hypothetical protein